jgi:hypothetical protein
LDRAVAVKGLPNTIGGYFLLGKVAETRSGAQVWLADDRSLGRRILIHAEPKLDDSNPPTRPTRLRSLNRGIVPWRERNWYWTAFAAPAGGPLADMIPAKSKLNWPDTRLLLEQIVEELRHAESDDTLPESLSLNHLWCEPMGRVVLLDFPMPSSLKTVAVEEPTDLVRQAATLMLEGAPRVDGPPVQAPLPPTASKITGRLFEERAGFANLAEIQTALGESHAQEPSVNGKMRATQIGIAALVALIPVALLFAATQFVSFVATMQHANLLAYSGRILDQCSDPETRAAWMEHESLKDKLADEAAFRSELAAITAREADRFDRCQSDLSRPERFVAMKYRALVAKPEANINVNAQGAAKFLENAGLANAIDWRSMAFRSGAIAVTVVLIVFVIFAFMFRGGLSYPLAGIALVQKDGRRAGRFRCALRELALWLPLAIALIAASWVQAEFPHFFALRLVAGGIAVAMLIAYLAIGFRSPEQGPHDRLLGTWRMPA